MSPTSGPLPGSGPSGTGSARHWRLWPAALQVSVGFGIVGTVLLIVGLVSGATPVLVAATTSGTLSLVSALVWRSQLIEAWRKEKGRPTQRW